MSTRATYLFLDTDSLSANVCLYIHHDGYLAGAASYFSRMYGVEGSSRSSAARFITANTNADFIHSHEAIGDTAFRYTVQGETVKACECVHQQNGQSKWVEVFNGDLVDFINQNGDFSERVFRVPGIHGINEIVTHSTAVDLAYKLVELHNNYVQNGHLNVAMQGGYRKRALRVAEITQDSDLSEVIIKSSLSIA